MAAEITQTRLAWLGQESQTHSPFTKHNCDFEFAFRPVFILLRCIGIDVEWGGEQRSRLRQNVARLASIFWCLVNVTVVVYWAILRIRQMKLEHPPTNEIVNKIIDFVMNASQIVLLHLVCAMAAWQDGRQLSEAFDMLQNYFANDSQSVTEMRRVAINAVAITLIAVN